MTHLSKTIVTWGQGELTVSASVFLVNIKPPFVTWECRKDFLIRNGGGQLSFFQQRQKRHYHLGTKWKDKAIPLIFLFKSCPLLFFGFLLLPSYFILRAPPPLFLLFPRALKVKFWTNETEALNHITHIEKLTQQIALPENATICPCMNADYIPGGHGTAAYSYFF